MKTPATKDMIDRLEETRSVSGLRQVLDRANLSNIVTIEEDGELRFGYQAEPAFQQVARRWLADHPAPTPAAPPGPPSLWSVFALEVRDPETVRTVTGTLRTGARFELPLREADYVTEGFVLTPSKRAARRPSPEEWARLRVAIPAVAERTLEQAETLRAHEEAQRAAELAEQARLRAEEQARAAEAARVEAARVNRVTLRSQGLWGWRGTLCPSFARHWTGRAQSAPSAPWRPEGRGGIWLFAGLEGIDSPGVEGWLPGDYEIELTRLELDMLLASLRGPDGRPWNSGAISEVLDCIAHHQPDTHRPLEPNELHGFESLGEEALTSEARAVAKKLAAPLRGFGATDPPYSIPHASSVLVRGWLRHPEVALKLLLDELPAQWRGTDILALNVRNAVAGMRPASMHVPGSMLPSAKREATVTQLHPEAPAAAETPQTYDCSAEGTVTMGAHFAAVTPSDTAQLPAACNDFYIGNAGTLNVVALGDLVANAVVLSVPAGVLRLPWPIYYVLATGTSATGIVGLGF